MATTKQVNVFSGLVDRDMKDTIQRYKCGWNYERESISMGSDSIKGQVINDLK